MIFGKELVGETILLRDIKVEDCSQKYVDWLQDKDTNRFLESRLMPQNIDTVRQFVQNTLASAINYMFAIVDKNTGEHIGNIKVGPIHPIYKSAILGYLIGDKNYWGKGVATEAVKLATIFCFEELKLNKVSAGVIAPNIASARVLEKVGFVIEGRFRQEVVVDGEFTDSLKYSVLKKEFKK